MRFVWGLVKGKGASLCGVPFFILAPFSVPQGKKIALVGTCGAYLGAPSGTAQNGENC